MAATHKQKRRRATRAEEISYRRSDAAKLHLARLSALSTAARLRNHYLDLKRQQAMGRKFRPSRFAGGYCATVDDLLWLVKQDIRLQLIGARSARTLGPVMQVLP
jgi:hypothetical protein